MLLRGPVEGGLLSAQALSETVQARHNLLQHPGQRLDGGAVRA